MSKIISIFRKLFGGPKDGPGIKSALLHTGMKVFPDHKDELAAFYNLYLESERKFLVQYAELLGEYDNFNRKSLEPLEVLYIFADSRGLVGMVDWRGEENESEIEEFADRLLGRSHTWENITGLRASLDEDDLIDGESTVDLLQSADKDLQTIGKRLLFLGLAWDAYVFTIVPSDVFDEVTGVLPKQFSGADKLRR